MENAKICNNYDLNETIAKEYLEQFTYPWEAIPGISDYILKLGPTLDKEKFEEISEHVWVAKSAKIAPSAYLGAPLIVDEEAEVGHCAFIRTSAIIGKGAYVGNSTEIKNDILFNGVQVPHYNYVGDSVLGNRAHLGAGVICANLRLDKGNVIVTLPEGKVNTNMRKLGAMLADEAEAGCNSVLQPGTILMKRSIVLSCMAFKGYLEENTIVGEKTQLKEMPRFGF